MHVKLFLKRIEVMLCKLFQAFPDALFHQLLVAMPTQTMRLDLERTVFSLSCSCHPLFSPWSDQDKKTSEAVSEIFGASASQKSKGFSFLGESKDNVDAVDGKLWEEGNSISNAGEKHDSHDHLNSFKHAAPDGKMVWSSKDFAFENSFSFQLGSPFHILSKWSHVVECLLAANFPSIEQPSNQSFAFIIMGSGNICREYAHKF